MLEAYALIAHEHGDTEIAARLHRGEHVAHASGFEARRVVGLICIANQVLCHRPHLFERHCLG